MCIRDRSSEDRADSRRDAAAIQPARVGGQIGRAARYSAADDLEFHPAVERIAGIVVAVADHGLP